MRMVSFIKDWGALIIAGISLLVAIISLSKSSKAQRLQNKVNELELKIKQDELDKITKEKEDAELACVEARFITVGKGKHRLKVWNSGNATAYHVSARFDGDVGIMILKKNLELPTEADLLAFMSLITNDDVQDFLLGYVLEAPKKGRDAYFQALDQQFDDFVATL